MEWFDITEKQPAVGQKVLLFDNGAVQEEIYEFDAADENDYSIVHFWDRDDLDEAVLVKKGQFWMPLPGPPQ